MTSESHAFKFTQSFMQFIENLNRPCLHLKKRRRKENRKTYSSLDSTMFTCWVNNQIRIVTFICFVPWNRICKAHAWYWHVYWALLVLLLLHQLKKNGKQFLALFLRHLAADWAKHPCSHTLRNSTGKHQILLVGIKRLDLSIGSSLSLYIMDIFVVCFIMYTFIPTILVKWYRHGHPAPGLLVSAVDLFFNIWTFRMNSFFFFGLLQV